MAIDPTQLGLGALPSGIDERDWDIDLAYAAAGIDPVAAPPASWLAPAPYPPVYNQGTSPMCVAYSSATSKAYQDLRDTGAFSPAFAAFFAQIGGTPNGAVPRVALQQMLDHGYPPVTGSASAHRIAAYYSVPVDATAIKSAIVSFGPVLFSSPWFSSWFRPVNGVLPAPDSAVGGHEYEVVGYDAVGFRIRNSWGPLWSQGGEATLPYSMLHLVREVWKSVDKIIAPPKHRAYTLRIAHGAHVKHYALTRAGCLTDMKVEPWTGKASTAGCSAPGIKHGCVRGQATVVRVPRGAFAGRSVWIASPGVKVTWR